MSLIWKKGMNLNVIISVCAPRQPHKYIDYIQTQSVVIRSKVCRLNLYSSVFCSCFPALPEIGFDFVFVAFFKFPPPWSAAVNMSKDPSLLSAFYKDRICAVYGGISAPQWIVFSASVSSPAGLNGRFLLNKCARIHGRQCSDADGALITFDWRTSGWR